MVEYRESEDLTVMGPALCEDGEGFGADVACCLALYMQSSSEPRSARESTGR